MEWSTTPPTIAGLDLSPTIAVLAPPGHVSGLELRYVLIWQLVQSGPLTVHELVAALASQGFVFAGRPSKSISDALRWEVRRGRAIRHARGRYGMGSMPRQTAARIRDRVGALRQEIVAQRRAE